MPDYDFKNLSDKEFESLSVDLLSIEQGVRFERFRPGRDGGVDGRYFSAGKREVILQCKHWARSSVAALISAITKSELPKIARLKPTRYILTTSLELSRSNKADIAKALGPYVRSDSDVYGKEDLNDLLAKQGDIERKHFKLWLTSTNILEQIVHAAIVGRSEFALEEIRDRAKLYVTTPNHKEAIKKLVEHGVVLITGEPGIGKTTLAQQLCLEHVAKGYQLCVIADSIDEAEGIYKPSLDQVFYFDDFLGRNYLSVLERHEDSNIVAFIRRIGRDKTKRFILTSRTTVLSQGKRLTDLFNIENIQKNEWEIRVDSLRQIDKAKILYNHVWFSDLNREYVEQILFHRRYRRVIDHRNFNPRLISFITTKSRLDGI